MTGGFGRKGLAAGSTGQGAPQGFGMGRGFADRVAPMGDAGPVGRASDEHGMSPELKAFLAAERQRKAQEPEGGLSDVAVATPRPSAGQARTPRNGAKKSMLLAYVLWHFGSALAAHRFYLGVYQSALMLTGLFWGGLLLMLVWPPLGLVSLAAWLIWLLADLFLIPGLTREANADVVDHAQVFA